MDYDYNTVEKLLTRGVLEARNKRMNENIFDVKDSGARESYAGGMVRDTAVGKINYALVADGPMLKRWAEHLTKGAEKYTKRNWMLAQGDEEYERARESAFRHFVQWFSGDRDEDHASAVYFNINEAEYIRANNNQSNRSSTPKRRYVTADELDAILDRDGGLRLGPVEVMSKESE